MRTMEPCEFIRTLRDIRNTLSAIEQSGAAWTAPPNWEEELAEPIRRFLLQHPDDSTVYGTVEVLQAVEVIDRCAQLSFLPIDLEQLIKLLDEVLVYLEDRAKPPLQRRYPLYIKHRLLENLQAPEAQALAAEEEIALYRMFALELCREGDKLGLEAVGYGCYGGCRAFDCDWDTARRCMERLMEISPEPEARPFYANTLGYIAYYGRCNGGIPQYDEAYKYFSYAALSGVVEAACKLADLYMYGQWAIRSPAAARTILLDWERATFRSFCSGDPDSAYADVARRLGFLEEDPNEARRYLTEARLAIRLRREHSRKYGDERVERAIEEALARVARDPDEEIFDPNPLLPLRSGIPKGCCMEMVARPLSEKQALVTFRLVRTHDADPERPAPRMFLSLPELGLCGWYEQYTVVFHEEHPCDLTPLLESLRFDEIFYDRMSFHGKEVFSFGLQMFEHRAAPIETRRIALCRCEKLGHQVVRLFCPNESIVPGCTVTKHIGDEILSYTVLEIRHIPDNELPYLPPLLGPAAPE